MAEAGLFPAFSKIKETPPKLCKIRTIIYHWHVRGDIITYPNYYSPTFQRSHPPRLLIPQ